MIFKTLSPQSEGFFYKEDFIKGFINNSATGFKLPVSKDSKALCLSFDEELKKLVAFCLFRQIPGNIIEIDYIASHKNELRKGFAKACLNELKRLYEPKEVWLEVSEFNLKAISFYEKVGFTKINERKDYYNQGEAAFLYSLNLQKD